MAERQDRGQPELSVLNPFPKPLPGPSLLHHLIKGESSRATAIEYHDSTGPLLELSYHDLHLRTSDLASLLGTIRHRSPSSIIPLLIPQCPALYISQIAILKSGAAFCPLNLDAPEDRLRFILEDIAAPVAITTSEFKHKFASHPDLPLVILDYEANVLNNESALPNGQQQQPPDQDHSHRSPCPADPAYIMYTSGSTGTPKAVSISHSAATQSLLAHDRFIPQFFRFLQFANPTFDVSVFEIFFPLFRGSTLVSCDRTHLLSDLPTVMTSLCVDAAEFTPSVVASLIRTRSNVPKLRTLLTIGEMLNPQTVREFAGSPKDEGLLFGMYGPTEAAIHCTLQPHFQKSHSVNTIGQPLDTVSCFVIRPAEGGSAPDEISILPIGEVGELAVGGLQLADGYLNREKQTAAVFIQHPTYGRLYRTGDKARLTSDGLLECLGRISKGQVKLRGQRMELGEVEHAASKLEGVHAASAAVDDNQLVLFCVADASIIQPADVENSCKKWLPQFMVPNDIIILKDFPYLPSGKTDLKRLLAEYAERRGNHDESQGQHEVVQDTELLKLLRSLIDKQLQPTSRLASSGLDSLKAIKLSTALTHHGYPQLSAVDILSCPTYTSLEDSVLRAKSRKPHPPDARLLPLKRDLRACILREHPQLEGMKLEIHPCTPLQDAMLAETAKDPKAYVNTVSLSIPSGTSFPAFREAFSMVAAHHSALRTGFLTSGHGISAFAQIEWNTLSDRQFEEVTEAQYELPMGSIQDFLLRPLLVHFASTEKRAEVVLHMHHALYDQWSLDILIDDIQRALDGLEIPTRPSFGNIAWQLMLANSAEDAQKPSRDFWRSYMTGSRATKLPNLTGKSSLGQTDFLKHHSRLSASKIAAVCSQYGVSESALFQTVYGYLLGLYSAQTDVVFGSVFSGRTEAIEGVQDVIGPMLTTLPMRQSTELSGRFQDAACSMHESNRTIMAHTRLPLSEIRKVAAMDPTEFLFDSIFVWQKTSRDGSNQQDVKLIETRDYVEFKLVLEAEPTEDTYVLKATFNTGVLPQAQIRNLFNQLEHALETVLENPECQLKDLFDSANSEPFMSIHNAEPKLRSCQGGLPQLMRQSLTKHSNDPALLIAEDITGDHMKTTMLTYSELFCRANSLSRHLLSEGLKPGSLVLILIEKSVELYVSILAAINAGCGYLPILPGTPKQRLEKAIEDFDIVYALYDDPSREAIEPFQLGHAICVSNLDLNKEVSSLDVAANPGDIAYAIWTSGTTGTPKGVVISQDNIVSNLMVLGDMYPVHSSSRLLQSCNQAFDVSVFEIFFTWAQGMCLCSAKNDVLFRDIEHAIRVMDITHLSMTPTVASLVDPANVPKVKFLVTAGEAVTNQVFRRWAGKGLWQGYGPSETTNICTVRPRVATDDAINNIGPPFSNTTAFILSTSTDFEVLPQGALGEICFSGQQVFPGYQKMLDLTSSKMIDHPKFGRIYRSGDLGRLSSHGDILIEGRIDTQRKIRGQRIELKEIVTCISNTPGVDEASVLITGASGAERLLGFWIPTQKRCDSYRVLELDDDLATLTLHIMQDLTSQLPSYMIPSTLIPLTTFPMTGQSKIDTRRMIKDANELAPDYFKFIESDGQDTDGDQELNSTEQIIQQAIVDVLAIPTTQVKRRTSLLTVGLDSISAIKLATRIRSATRVQLDVSSILRQPNLASLAAKVTIKSDCKPDVNGTTTSAAQVLHEESRASIRDACKSRNLLVDRILPCTPLQEAMLSATMASESSSYANRTVLQLNISAQKLRGYFDIMLRRHQILRTIFLSTEDNQYPFVQTVLQDIEMPWASMDESVEQSRLLEQKDVQLSSPVDSFKVPYCFRILKAGGQTSLVIDMHHSLYDANALSILFVEVERLHNEQSLDSPIAFDQFLDYMISQPPEDADQFFDRMLQDFTPPPPKISPQDGKLYETLTIPTDIPMDEMRHFCAEYGVSLLALSHAAWSTVLSSLYDSRDVCFGNVVSGRSVPVEGVDRLVAPCFNTIPVRVDLGTQKTFMDLVKHLHQINIDTLQHQLTPLRRIQQRHGVQNLFNSLLILQQPEAPLDSSIWKMMGETGDMDFPCIIELIPKSDRILISLHYERHLFDNEHQVAAVFNNIIDAFLSILRYPLRDLASNRFSNGLVGAFVQTKANGITEHGKVTNNDHDNWSSTERQIKEVFLSLSSSRRINTTRHTTIYQLGLDSISAIQAAKKLRSKGIGVDATDILQNPTCAKLSTFLDAKTHKGSQPTDISQFFDFSSFDKKHRSSVVKRLKIDETSVQAVRPCTGVQEGLQSAFIRSNGQHYLNHFAYSLDSKYSAEALKGVWKKVIQRHEILRTTLVDVEDAHSSFAMVTFKYGHRELVSIISRGDYDEENDMLDEQNTKSILQSFQIPPWRCTLIDRGGKLHMHMSMHHALYDAESFTQILHDLKTLVDGDNLSGTPTIDQALSYILLRNRPSHANEQFWKDTLKNVTTTSLPNLHPVIVSDKGVSETFLDASLSISALEDLCSRRGISANAVYQSAWAKLLSMYTGEDQVTFGVVTAGRASQETEDACFPCINTLPVTCDTSANDSSILQTFTTFNADVQAHAFTPLSSIQHWLGLQNEAMFNTIFAFQKPVQPGRTDRWDLVHEKAAVDFAVSIEVEHLQNDVLRLRCTFDASVLPKAQVDMMLQQLDALAFSFLDQSGARIPQSGLLSILPAHDPIIGSDLKTLLDMFEQSLTRNPQKIALEFVSESTPGKRQSQSWTYAELDARANQVAHLLQSNGTKPGSIVALCFEKCPEASFAFLGVLKAGCTILAIDHTAPLARKEFVLSDARASAVLCSSTVALELSNQEDSVVIDLQIDLKDDLPTSAPGMTSNVTADSISYILYTSGTTGTPKGCELTNDNAVQALLAFQRLFKDRWTASSVCCQFASYHFDVAILEHFWTWSMGIKLICAPRDLILEDLAGFIDQYQVTHIDLTPSLGRLLDPELVRSLHSGVFITGGEAVKPEMLRAWGDIGCLFNFYGPTECTIGVTTFPSVPTNGKASNIGWQFDNVGTCVLKPGTDEPVLRGGIGELCIFGKLVGKGYLNRPDLTKERFPYVESIGERIYRTGDLVRILHDDSIEFLGRADSQVKLRGQRLEIDEIIAVMRQNGSVEDAVCIVTRHDDKQKDQLVAFVSSSTHRRHDSPTLTKGGTLQSMIARARAACEERLPGYMVPTHFIPVDFIPLSVNNKQDDKALKQLFQALNTAQLQELGTPDEDNRALTRAERTILDSLSATLGVSIEDAKPSANMFSLGLSSISAIQLTRRLKVAGLEKSSITVVMQHPTISRLAKALEASSATNQSSAAVLRARQAISVCQQRSLGVAARQLKCSVGDIQQIAPCTPLQQGIIYKSLSAGDGLYFNRFLFEDTRKDADSLRGAFDKLVKCTDILRTSFVQTDDGHVQVLMKRKALEWRLLTVGAGEKVEAVLDQAHKEWNRSNDLVLKDPFAVTVVTECSRQICQVSIHHAIYDGNAWSLLLRQLERILRGQELEQDKHGFFKILAHGPLAQHTGAKDFWREQLKGASFCPMQRHIDRAELKDPLVTRNALQVGPLTGACRRLGVTAQAIVQAAWTVTLAKYHTGPLGLIISGRSIDVDAADVIGPMFNTIPFAWNLERDDTWEDVVKRSHEFNVASLPFQHTALRDISKWVHIGAEQPLFDTLFVFQPPQEELSSTDRTLEPIENEGYVADYPLSFEAEQQADGTLNITIGAQRNYFDKQVLAGMISELESNLSALVEDSSSTPNIASSYFSERQQTPSRNGRVEKVNGITSFAWTSEAETLRSELARLAGVDEGQIDEHTTMLALGLDSIDAVKLSSRLRQHGMVIQVSKLVQSQTIPAILSNCQLSGGDTEDNRNVESRNAAQKSLESYVLSRLTDHSNIEQILPATPMQEGLISEMVRSDYEAYFNQDVLEISSDVDVQKLLDAWTQVVSASPILRTRFIEVEDAALELAYAQVVLKSHQFIHEAKAGVSIDECLVKVKLEAKAEGLAGPPFRLIVLEKPDKRYLILSLAHALYDGFSIGLLHRDVHDAYNGTLSPRPDHGPVVHRAVEAASEESSSFWQATLTGVSSTIIDKSKSTNETGTHRCERTSKLSAGSIVSASKTFGVTVQAMCQTAWSLALAERTRSMDVLYGLVFAGRDSPEAEAVLFPTMNTVVFRSALYGTCRDLVKDTQAKLIEMMPYQQTPLRHVQNIARKSNPDLSGPLFDTLFTYQKGAAETSANEESLYTSIQSASDVDYPVAIEAELVGDSLVWRTAVKSSVFSYEQVEQLLQDTDTYFKTLVHNPDLEVLDFSGDGVSILGGKPFQLQDKTSEEASLRNDNSAPHEGQQPSALEESIRGVVATVAKVDLAEVIRNTRLDNLGIDSISAIKVSSLLRKQFINLSVSKVVQAGTVAELASIAAETQPAQEDTTNYASEALRRRKITPEALNLDKNEIECLLPATAGQTYLLSAWLNSKGELFYPTFTYSISEVEDATVIHAAWDRLQQHHPILRTTFVATHDKDIPFIQAVYSTKANSKALVRLDLVHQKGQVLLKVTIHHALYDAVSLDLLIRDLATLLSGHRSLSSSSDLAPFLSLSLSEGARQKQETFWKEYLEGLQNNESVVAYGGRRTEVFDPEVFQINDREESKLRKEGISIQSLFFATYAILYGKLNRTEDVVIGIYLANRAHSEGLAAPTVNLVPLRIRLGQDIVSIARQIQVDLKTVGQQDLSAASLWDIKRWTGVTVHTFVNFIRLPDSATDETRRVRIENLDDEREFRKRAIVHEAKQPEEFEVPEKLKGSGVGDAYPPTLDVEATVREGKLAIGVFGYESRVKLEQAQQLIEGLRQELQSHLE